MEAAARANGRRLIDLHDGPDVGTIFATKQNGTGALVLDGSHVHRLARSGHRACGATMAFPIFPNREYILSGGLISFGADLYEHYRVAGAYAGRILKGGGRVTCRCGP